MFDFLYIAPYADRKVGWWNSDDELRMVSTCSVNDGDHPFETAFQHPEYNAGKMVIVEAYDTREDAANGHERWLRVMLDGPLPDALTDCCNAKISQMLGERSFPRTRTQ